MNFPKRMLDLQMMEDRTAVHNIEGGIRKRESGCIAPDEICNRPNSLLRPPQEISRQVNPDNVAVRIRNPACEFTGAAANLERPHPRLDPAQFDKEARAPIGAPTPSRRGPSPDSLNVLPCNVAMVFDLAAAPCFG
jgi:hypothetical protein